MAILVTPSTSTEYAQVLALLQNLSALTGGAAVVSLEPRAQLCDGCREQKVTTYLTQIVRGEMQRLGLCEACAKAVEPVLTP